ncbi:Uncharacterised protein [Pseudomonas fluorescens]|uniref:Lipoprotein n=1 Tax=Pseudomonas fluorescens TaxID=294 RepID=A0A3S4QNX0_PSEFL|nr:hypothetical protein [Pseudomonas fluorescens]VEF11522.1 Uncharacterised protein [Pseudomonas fluorescens]
MSPINLKSMTGLRLKIPLLVTALFALTGCQKLTFDQRLEAYMDSGGKSAPMYLMSAEIKRMELRSYVRMLRSSLARSIFKANSKGLAGSAKLRMKLDRQGNVLLCEAQADAPGQSDLSKLLTDVCWSSVWSALPENMQNPLDGTVEIVAPFVVSGGTPTEADGLKDQTRESQSRFFWDNVLAGKSTHGFGRVRFKLTATANGQVDSCDVTLEQKAARPDEFHPDPALQKTFTQQCLQLDLRKMPGFGVDENGIARRTVYVDYLPWKYHVGKYSD